MGDVIRDPEGKPLRLLGMAQDITERKEAELERERYAQDLVRSNRELEQFARLVSHDLRAPLRTVIGFLRLLEEDRGEGLDDEAREYVTYASESAARMQRMIDAMLEYARLEGEIEPFGPVDCEALLAQTLHDLRFVIDEWEGVVTSDPLPVVWGDSVQLSLVFQNLVSNALKFQREGHTPRVHVSVEKDEEEWLFSVEDNGIGISERHQKRLFQVFSRLHTPQEYPGLGVGLATCKKVVDRHGGRIWVESEPGVGSTFYFSIPLEGTQTQL
jgi:signal transduction histidine kinase